MKMSPHGSRVVFCRRWFLVAVAAGFLQVWQAKSFAQSPTPGNPQTTSPASNPDVIKIAPDDRVQGHRASEPANAPPQKIPNFTSCTIDELRQIVPALKGLQPAQEQADLAPLLQKVGAKTQDIVQRTPNLISHETVISGLGFQKTRQDFSYLVLTHAEGSDRVVFDEFRTDLATGEKMHTEDLEKLVASDAGATSSQPPDRASDIQKLPAVQSAQSGPLAQGFANAWSHFYPLNQPESDFRYLGQQKIDGHHTQVLAFVEKPGAVPMPAILRLENKTAPIYFQGVAWVDASDFRIVRLRTDLQSPVLGLKRLMANIEFGQVRISDVASPLWLPHEVEVNSRREDGSVLNEVHKYSDYRLFRTRTKIVMNP